MNDKHLEFIQGVINRHNSNSFMIKGWSVTLVAAIFALAGTVNDPNLSTIAFGPIIIFWILDSVFLANERCFVSLYSCVVGGMSLSIEKNKIKKKHQKILEIKTVDNKAWIELKTKDYSMNFKEFRKIKRNNWYRVLFSYTIFWFYSILFVLTLSGYFGIKFNNKPDKGEISKVKSISLNDEIPVSFIYLR